MRFKSYLRSCTFAFFLIATSIATQVFAEEEYLEINPDEAQWANEHFPGAVSIRYDKGIKRVLVRFRKKDDKDTNPGIKRLPNGDYEYYGKNDNTPRDTIPKRDLHDGILFLGKLRAKGDVSRASEDEERTKNAHNKLATDDLVQGWNDWLKKYYYVQLTSDGCTVLKDPELKEQRGKAEALEEATKRKTTPPDANSDAILSLGELSAANQRLEKTDEEDRKKRSTEVDDSSSDEKGTRDLRQKSTNSQLRNRLKNCIRAIQNDRDIQQSAALRDEQLREGSITLSAEADPFLKKCHWTNADGEVDDDAKPGSFRAQRSANITRACGDKKICVGHITCTVKFSDTVRVIGQSDQSDEVDYTVPAGCVTEGPDDECPDPTQCAKQQGVFRKGEALAAHTNTSKSGFRKAGTAAESAR